MGNFMIEALTFDDVLLVPKYSTIESRSKVDISTSLSDRRSSPLFNIKLPIISSNMSTVTESKMALAMGKAGGLGFIHRFLTDEQLRPILDELTKNNVQRIISIGVDSNEQDIRRIDYFLSHRLIDAVCIDIAHADHLKAILTIKALSERFPSLDIVAGNVVTADGAERLASAGATIIKIGIGSSKICSTRIKTGHGYPQLSAVMNIYERVKGSAFIISDGGVKTPGDCVKALAAGADAVMCGSLLSSTDEAPGELIEQGDKVYKIYSGMASFQVQKEKRPDKTPRVEGISKLVPYKGPVRRILDDLEAGIRSGFSYSGAANLQELRNNAEFIKITSNGYIEGLTS